MEVLKTLSNNTIYHLLESWNFYNTEPGMIVNMENSDPVLIRVLKKHYQWRMRKYKMLEMSDAYETKMERLLNLRKHDVYFLGVMRKYYIKKTGMNIIYNIKWVEIEDTVRRKNNIYSQLENVLEYNNITSIFKKIIDKVIVDLTLSRPITISHSKINKIKIMYNNYNICDIINYHHQEKEFFDSFDYNGMDGLSKCDKDTIVASCYIKGQLVKIKNVLTKNSLLISEPFENVLENNNDILSIFEKIIENGNIFVDLTLSKPINILHPKTNKFKIMCNNYDICNIIDYHYQERKFFDSFDYNSLDGLAKCFKDAIVASCYIKEQLPKIQIALLKNGPLLCELVANNTTLNIVEYRRTDWMFNNEVIIIKQKLILLNKYFHGIISKINVNFNTNFRIKCVGGCGTRIFICKDSIISSIPKCINCEKNIKDHFKIIQNMKDNGWEKCWGCKCLFLSNNNNMYMRCQVCISH